MTMPLLHHKIKGSGQPFVFLHGLLGSGDNWKSIARAYEDRFATILVDQRNHGRSFHADHMSYGEMAKDVAELISQLGVGPAVVLGHSMGGKVAMALARMYPEHCDRLIIVDSSPLEFHSGHKDIVDLIANTDLSEYEDRKSIEAHLTQGLQSQGLAYFIMKNITRKGKAYRWKLNIDVIQSDYPLIMSGILDLGQDYAGTSLFIKGEDSDYIGYDEERAIYSHFDDVDVISVKNAGHWVHSDQPDELKSIISTFLSQSEHTT